MDSNIANPTVISQSSELEEDQNNIKIFTLGFLGVVFSFVAVNFFNRFLLTISYSDFWWSIFFGVIFVILTILQSAFIKSSSKVNLIVFLEVLVPLCLFYRSLYPRPSIALVFGALLFLFFLSLGTNHGAKLLKNSVRVDFILTSRMVIPKAVSAILIFLSASFYVNYC